MGFFYHTSNDNLEEGVMLEPRYGLKILDSRFYSYSADFHAQYLREMIIEDFRAVHFPDKPSRLKSVFLFGDKQLAIQYKRKQEKKYIYKVEIKENSKVLNADMNFIDLTVGKSVQEIHQLASLYFNGDSTNDPNYEILCEGSAKIVRQIEII